MAPRSRGMLVAASFATLVVGACVADSPTGVAHSTKAGLASEPMPIRSVIRDATTHNVIYGGAQAATVTVNENGTSSVSGAEQILDNAAIARLHQEFVAHLPAVGAAALHPESSDRSSHRHASQWAVLRNTRTVAGHAVDVGVAYDPEGKAPPRGLVVYVDGKVSLVSEFQHETVNGKSQMRRMRATFFDAHGKPTLVQENDIGPVAPRTSASVIGTMGSRARRLLPTLARLVEPDALYAQEVRSTGDSGEDDAATRCLDQATDLATAALLATAAAATVVAARTAVTTAELAMAAVCVEAPPVCAAAFPALASAISGAEAGVVAAATASVAAAVNLVSKTKALLACMRTPITKTAVQIADSGSGIDPGDDDVAPPSGGSCYITVYYDDYGNIFAAEDPYGCLNG